MTNKIFELISALNLTPTEFADKIGISRSTISSIKTGRTQPTLFLIQQIKQSYPSFDTNWLFGDSPNNEIFNSENSRTIVKQCDDFISENDNTIIHDCDISDNIECNDDKGNVQTRLHFNDELNNNSTFERNNDNKNVITPLSVSSSKSISSGIIESQRDINHKSFNDEPKSTNPDRITCNSSPKILRIITFFSDGTFQQFTPE